MRSIRAGNFTLYIQTLTMLVHWFFTFDHYHYVRWISVHIREVMTLSPGFLKGYFPVNMTSHVFSNLAIDKPYDQHNAGVKDDGGAVGLTECPATLQKWMFSGPEMARVII